MLLHPVQDFRMAFRCAVASSVECEFIPAAAVLSCPLNDRKMASTGSSRTNLGVPWTTFLSCPLQHLKATLCGGISCSPFIPLTPLLSRPLQHLKVTYTCCKFLLSRNTRFLSTTSTPQGVLFGQHFHKFVRPIDNLSLLRTGSTSILPFFSGAMTRPFVKDTSLAFKPLQHFELTLSGSMTSSIPIQRTFFGFQPLQHLKVASFSGIGTNIPFIPRTSVISYPL